ncbi:MAG: TonB-dependent receptor [Tidjanibacter sp.]|nr:TonB-dependent receptor [Tidjanibacter sp.]
MTKILALLLLLCGTIVSPTASATTPVIPQPRPTDAHIFGHVVDKATGEHLPYVSVVIEGTTIGVTTDATGHYLIKNMTPGTYTIEASAVGYIPTTKSVKVVAGQTIEIKFELTEDAVTLDQIVVSSNRSETLKREAPSLVSVVDAEVFDRVSATSLAGGLAFQPGVRVENTCQNCGFPQVRINGLDGRYSQILVDSHPLFSSLTGVYGLEQIPANMIERVEVLRGGGSALYGSSAIGGTINIITKEPKQSMAEMSHTTTSIGMGGAMENATSLNASLVSDSGKAAVSVFAQSRTTGGYDVDGDGFTELLESNAEALGMRSMFRLSNYSRITAQYHRIKDYRRGGDNLDLPQHEAEVCEQADHTIDGGSLTYDWSDPTHTNRLNIYGSFQNTARKSYYGAGKDPDAYGRTHDLTAAAGVQWVHEFDHLLFMPSVLTLGSEVSHNDLHDTSIGYNIDTKQVANIYGAYFQNEWRNSQWSILLGGRLDKHNLVSAPIFSPRANLRYNPTEEVSLRLSYAEGYRAPQAYDEDLHIAIVGGERTRIQLANDLREERSRSLSASAEVYHTFGSVATNIIVEGFYTRLEDVFALREIGHDDAGVAVQERYNGSGATVSGVNIEGRAMFGRKVELQAGFTLQRSLYAEPEQWSETAEASLNMFRTPDAYGYFTLMWKPMAKLNIDLSGNYTGPMWVQHYAGYIAEDVAVRTQSFFDASLRVGYTTLVYDDTFIELFGGVKNIFNSFQNDFDQGADRDSGYIYGPLMPRSAYLGVEIRF